MGVIDTLLGREDDRSESDPDVSGATMFPSRNGDSDTRLRSILDRINVLSRDLGTENRGGDPSSLDEGLKFLISGIAVLAGVLVAALTIPGVAAGGLLLWAAGNPQLAIGLVIGFTLLVWTTTQSGTVSFPFALSGVAISGIAWMFVPDTVKTVLPIGKWLGLRQLGLNTPRLAFFSFLAITVYFVISVRISGRAKNADTIADRVFARYADLAETYLQIARLAGLFLAAVVLFLFVELGALLAPIGDALAREPFIGSTIVTTLAGFQSLGGSLPVVGQLPLLSTLSAGEFLVLALLAILLAGAAYQQGSGTLARVFR